MKKGGRGGGQQAQELMQLWSQTFLDKKSIPYGIRMVALLNKEGGVDKATYSKMLKYAVQQACGEQVGIEGTLDVAANPHLGTICNGLYAILTCAIRLRISDSDMLSSLRGVNMPQQFLAELCRVYKSAGGSLSEAASSHVLAFPSILDVQWRVDVTISTTSLSRAFQPTVLMQLTLSSGRVACFELSVQRFHQLRYNVAKALKSMQDLKQHPTLLREI